MFIIKGFNSNFAKFLAKNSATDFFRRFFDVSFFLLVSPFRLTEKGNIIKSEISVYTWMPHLLVSGTLTICYYVWILRELSSIYPRKWKNPSLYFVMLQKYAGALNTTILMKILWMDREQFAAILNFIRNRRNYFPACHPIITNGKRIVVCVSVMYAGNALLQTVTGRSSSNASLDSRAKNISTSGWLEQWWHTMIRTGWSNLFLGNFTGFSKTVAPTFVDHMVGVITTCGLYQR